MAHRATTREIDVFLPDATPKASAGDVVQDATGKSCPLEIQQKIDIDSYRFPQISDGQVALATSGGRLEAMRTKEHGETPPGELEALSRIIADLNDRFFIEMGPEHRIPLAS